jgi:hypothetical protein
VLEVTGDCGWGAGTSSGIGERGGESGDADGSFGVSSGGEVVLAVAGGFAGGSTGTSGIGERDGEKEGGDGLSGVLSGGELVAGEEDGDGISGGFAVIEADAGKSVGEGISGVLLRSEIGTGRNERRLRVGLWADDSWRLEFGEVMVTKMGFERSSRTKTSEKDWRRGMGGVGAQKRQKRAWGKERIMDDSPSGW